MQKLEEGGPVVGLLSGLTYTQGTADLQSGDRIVIFSDGVSEAMSATGEEFGDDRLISVIEDARKGDAEIDAPKLVDELIAGVRAFTAGAPQSDDITAMVLRYGV